MVSHLSYRALASERALQGSNLVFESSLADGRHSVAVEAVDRSRVLHDTYGNIGGEELGDELVILVSQWIEFSDPDRRRRAPAHIVDKGR